VFDDIQLLYGENKIRVVLYGPQGQVREREQIYNVGLDSVPKGKTWYWIGANEPGRDLVTLEKPPDDFQQPQAQAPAAVEHGLDAPLKLGKAMIPAHAEAHLIDRADGSRVLEAAARLSASIDRFNLGTELSYHKDYVPAGPAPPGELKLGLLGSGHIGDVRLR